MMDGDPFSTQRDVGSAVAAELRAAGFDGAEEIGRGGFGIVYRCVQVALDRTVAVKVLTAGLDEDRHRFVREQRAMGRLTGHPNIAGVLQVGETESGYPYLVMQYHRQGSIEARIRRLGALPLADVLRLGVKMAGALESAHRLAILHRDVKPANILLTDYGEPALSDFGIAHISGGFKTATGSFTGSPAFTAPEILSGDPPGQASDVYGLGATLFCALTGHAAFERQSGEQVVAQFLRIATEPVPDLHEHGIPDDIAAIVDKAMSRDPHGRPSAIGLGEELQRAQSRHGFAVDDMALLGGEQPDRPARTAGQVAVRRARGNLPLELTSFVGRRAELSDVHRLLSASRLVTLTGIGGVGKTRLSLHAAAESARDFPDGVWLVELGELRDGSLLVDVVAAALGVRDEPARSLRDVLVEFLSPRRLLLVLDNCEQVLDEAAALVSTLLKACPELRILVTSRERLGVGGESLLSLAPLACPDAVREPTPPTQPDDDAVALFAERAASAVPGFRLTENNTATVARICSRLDGLPLAIELAAARLPAMSPQQLLERLADRYALLTRGSRGGPTRQQTLAWSVGWSYDLCTRAEQQMWGRLSVFAGGFDLESAHDICGEELAPDSVVDVLSALVDKSILIRTEAGGVVRFRMLDTLRDYGGQQLTNTEHYRSLRGRHRDWYRRLLAEAAAEWFGPRQIQWTERIVAEMPNLREALDFSLVDSGEGALVMAGAMHPVWLARGMLTEGRRWLDRALAVTAREPNGDRIRALYAAATIAGMQGDMVAAKTRVAEARSLTEQVTDPVVHGLTDLADGYTALVSGEFTRACDLFEDALAASDDPEVRAASMLLTGWALEFLGELDWALIWHEKALAFAESRGETVYRSYALWSVGVGWWRHGQQDRAQQLLTQCLQLTQLVNDPRQAAGCLEALAWMARSRGDPRRAVVLMGAADALGRIAGASALPFPDLAAFHDECERRARDELGEEAFDAAWCEGNALGLDDAVGFALEG